MVVCSCGLCVSKETICDDCVNDTLKANGLPITLFNELKGLSNRDYYHVWGDYSPLKEKLRDLIRRHNETT